MDIKHSFRLFKSVTILLWLFWGWACSSNLSLSGSTSDNSKSETERNAGQTGPDQSDNDDNNSNNNDENSNPLPKGPGEFAIEKVADVSTNSSVTVNWKASDGASSFNISIASDSACKTVIQTKTSSAELSITFGDLADGTYFICIESSNESGSTKATNNGVSFTVGSPSSTAIEYPKTTLNASTNNSSSINLNWTNIENETGYAIERATAPGGACGTYSQIASVATNITSYVDGSLSSDTEYCYRIIAKFLGDQQTTSNVSKAKTSADNRRIYVADENLGRISYWDIGKNRIKSGINSSLSYYLTVTDGSSTYFSIGNQGIFSHALDGSGTQLLHQAYSPIDLTYLSAQGPVPAKIYWIEYHASGVIKRSNTDASSTETIYTAPTGEQLSGLEIDSSTKKLFWSNKTSGQIERSNLDGSNQELVLSGLSTPGDLAIDATADALFWTENQNIFAAKRDGSSKVQIGTSLSGLRQIRVNKTAQKLFWAENKYAASVAHIGSMDYDGSNIAGFDVPGNPTVGVFLISPDDKLIWGQTAAGTTTLIKANLDGSSPSTVATDASFVCFDGATIDYVDSKIYYADNCSDLSIKSSDLSGGSVTSISSISSVYAVEVDKTDNKIYWMNNVNNATNGGIFKSDLDGSNKVRLVDQTMRGNSLVLEPDDEKLYWIDRNCNFIRSDTDGSNIATVVSDCTHFSNAKQLTIDFSDDILLLGTLNGVVKCKADGSNCSVISADVPVYAVTYDPIGKKVYYSDGDSSTNVSLNRVNPDGSNAEMLLDGFNYVTKLFFLDAQ